MSKLQNSNNSQNLSSNLKILENSNQNKNPFTKPEILESHFEKEQNYNNFKTNSLNNFITNYKSKFLAKNNNLQVNSINSPSKNLQNKSTFPKTKTLNFPIFSIFSNISCLFKNPILRLAGISFVVFCVSFTTIFTGILVYSQTLPENKSSLELEIKKNTEKTDQCKNLKVNYTGELDVKKIDRSRKLEDKTFYFNALSVIEKKNIDEGKYEKLGERSFVIQQYNFSVNCEGKFYKDWNEFYDRSINQKPPETYEYFKCVVRRVWKWREDQRQVYCPSVDNQAQTSQIHIDELPFLSSEFRTKIQKDKLFKAKGGLLGNNYFRNTDTTIYFLDENNVLYSMNLYPGTAEYFARNYNLVIGLE